MDRLRWVGWLAACGLLGAAACSSSSSDTCASGRCGFTGNPVADPGAGGSDDDGAGGGGGALDFGNPETPVAPPTMSPGEGGGDGEGEGEGDDGPCEVGQFCAPTAPDPDNCGTLRLESDVEVTVEPGNLLVIFDQSGSMRDLWPGTGSDKATAARTALEAAIESLKDNVTVGAILFPTYACVPALPPPPGGAVAPITDPLQIDFMGGAEFLTAWNTYWTSGVGALSIGLGTPMNEAFDRADVAIQSAGLTGATAVVVFTDGAPNCLPDPNLTMVPTMPEPQRAADWLANLGIKTYVVGLPGAAGVQVLNNVAMSGGTTEYIVPDDPAQLEMKLREVVEETVMSGFNSCSITLNPAADVPDELLMIVEEPGVGEQQVPRDRGWSLDTAGSQVEITGELCDDAMGGRFTSITFEYACPDVPPPPALPPVR